MKENDENLKTGFKGFWDYISTVVSWTIFVLLIIIGVLLVYYYVFVKLYAVKGDKFEPKFSIYNVATGSMEPTINVDDVVINVKVDSIDDVKINDVITFISAWQLNYGMTMTHRVVGVQTLDDGSKCLITRGDNVTQEDAACVSEENLIGVVKAVVPGLGKVQRFLSSTLGWLLIIIIPALYIIVKDIIKIINLLSKKNNENNLNTESIELVELEDYDKLKKYDKKKIINDNKKSKKETDDERIENAFKELESVRKK